MQKELIAIGLAPYRRIILNKILSDRADDQGVNRAEIPLPLTTAEGEQPTFNDIASAAMTMHCRIEIADIRFVPMENDRQGF